MRIIEAIGEAYLLESNHFTDSRGGFLKVFNTEIELLKDYAIKQINYVVTKEKHTLRGLHFQRDKYAESKVFRVVKGTAQLGFVDVRPGSKAYLRSYTCLLNDPKKAVIIPRGFATGYCTLSDDVEMLYTSDNIHHAPAETGLLWNDARLAIEWLVKDPILSAKDRAWKTVQ